MTQLEQREPKSVSRAGNKSLQSFLEMRRTNLNTITIINDDATTVSAVGLILVEGFLLAKAAMLTTTDIAIGTRPMAGNGLAVTTPEGIKRARAGTKATMVMMRRVRSGQPLEVLEELAMSALCLGLGEQ
jgi:hypothetical protein